MHECKIYVKRVKDNIHNYEDIGDTVFSENEWTIKDTVATKSQDCI